MVEKSVIPVIKWKVLEEKEILFLCKFILQLLAVWGYVLLSQKLDFNWHLSPSCHKGEQAPSWVFALEQAVRQETKVNYCRQNDPRSCHPQIFKNPVERFLFSSRKRGVRLCDMQGRMASLQKTGPNVPVKGIYHLLRRWLCYMEELMFPGSGCLFYPV
jgi:hypothetical protein